MSHVLFPARVVSAVFFQSPTTERAHNEQPPPRSSNPFLKIRRAGTSTCANICADCDVQVGQPFDTIKTRLQVLGQGTALAKTMPPEYVYKHSMDCFRKMLKHEGPLSFYKVRARHGGHDAHVHACVGGAGSHCTAAVVWTETPACCTHACMHSWPRRRTHASMQPGASQAARQAGQRTCTHVSRDTGRLRARAA